MRVLNESECLAVEGLFKLSTSSETLFFIVDLLVPALVDELYYSYATHQGFAMRVMDRVALGGLTIVVLAVFHAYEE